MTDLSFMGMCEPEGWRARVYAPQDKVDGQRIGFVQALADDGVLDCPAYDEWIKAFQMRGWVPLDPEWEPAPEGGRYARWRLTEAGYAALHRFLKGRGA